MTEILEMAETLGRSVGRTTEHRVLSRALAAAHDDREFVKLNNELESLFESMRSEALQGRNPAAEDQRRHDELLGKLEALSAYQSLVAAQSNFEKLMVKVDAAMKEGIRKGATSPILVVS